MRSVERRAICSFLVAINELHEMLPRCEMRGEFTLLTTLLKQQWTVKIMRRPRKSITKGDSVVA